MDNVKFVKHIFDQHAYGKIDTIFVIIKVIPNRSEMDMYERM